MKGRLSALILLLLVSFSISAQENKKQERKQYSIEQATSDRAQLHTIAFDGLAFITGSFGADTFFPPGKLSDFFGFQYMRDNDSNSLGHNTDFLTRIATNVINILSKEQMAKLIALAKEQEKLYEDFASKRMVLIKAFRQVLEQETGKQTISLDKAAVIKFCSELYAIDGELSYRRAEVTGEIIHSLSDEQKVAFARLSFGNSGTWPQMEENLDKKSLSHRAHVCVMTYASELFSWYKGSVTADVYFCPERHGTYFGGFYLKDYPAMGNKGYSISTALTGDAGKAFLDVLNPDQRKQIESLPAMQKKNLQEIVSLRTSVATNLRKFITGEKVDKATILAFVKRYGEQDGEMSFYYASAFAAVNKTLSEKQKQDLRKLRGLDVFPKGAYVYSDNIEMPAGIDCDFLLNVK